MESGYMRAVEAVLTKMSPLPELSGWTKTVASGDASTVAMHGSRREIAWFIDRLVRRSQRIPVSHERAAIITAGRMAYDLIARELDLRGAL